MDWDHDYNRFDDAWGRHQIDLRLLQDEMERVRRRQVERQLGYARLPAGEVLEQISRANEPLRPEPSPAARLAQDRWNEIQAAELEAIRVRGCDPRIWTIKRNGKLKRRDLRRSWPDDGV
jgi:hypothetical protein